MCCCGLIPITIGIYTTHLPLDILLWCIKLIILVIFSSALQPFASLLSSTCHYMIPIFLCLLVTDELMEFLCYLVAGYNTMLVWRVSDVISSIEFSTMTSTNKENYSTVRSFGHCGLYCWTIVLSCLSHVGSCKHLNMGSCLGVVCTVFFACVAQHVCLFVLCHIHCYPPVLLLGYLGGGGTPGGLVFLYIFIGVRESILGGHTMFWYRHWLDCLIKFLYFL